MIAFLPRNWTFRFRMTALYGGLFFVTGGLMLVVTYVLLAQALGGQLTATIASEVPTGGDGTQPVVEQELYRFATSLKADFQHETLSLLASFGAIALGAVGAGGVWMGWLTAKRSLRPLQQITATARRVAESTLHERIAMTGPPDELRELADTFDSMLERLDHSFDSQRRFVANASHELRTPMAITRTALELALDRPDTSTDLRQTAELLLDVNTRQERLIEGLLTLARSDGAIPDRHAVDLAEVATHVVDQVSDEAADAGIEIRTSLRPTETLGSTVLLERLTLNLLQNALRHNERGGWAEVTVQNRGSAELTVTNTGPTVATYEVLGLFEPFRRLTDRVGSAQGVGLGLSIVHAVARTHGGAVTAEPRAGGGLTVRVELPSGKPKHRPPTSGTGRSR